jgi:ABC-type sugar transport system ATPase subunit
MNENSLLDMRDITKLYPGVKALDSVDFELDKGEVHALVGENGAGKSTLMKILMGIEQKNQGIIRLKGQSVNFNNSHEAGEYGIASVFQELSQIPYLSVAENIFIKTQSVFSFINRREKVKQVKEVFDKYDICINPESLMINLPPAQQQLVEIIKAILCNPDILILDEPTSSLTDDEAKKLFDIIETFKKNKKGIIYISHRMNELKLIADRITVLRDGKKISTKKMKGLTIKDIIKDMVGRDVDLYEKVFIEKREERSLPVLEVRELYKRKMFSNINFKLFKGEILGIAGLVGSGRSELMQIIFGINKADSGTILINGAGCEIKSVRDALGKKMAMVPESRHKEGLVLIHSIVDNVSLPVIKKFQRTLFLNKKKSKEFAKEMITKYNVRTNSIEKIVKYLSGGNQQKVVVAKWLATEPEILIIDEPTAGIDVHSKAEIHRMIRELTVNGLSVIMISSEMEELIANSDRIMVMNDYKILGTLANPDQEMIMNMIMEDKNILSKGCE